MVFILKKQVIGCTRVKAGKCHFAPSRTDMSVWFITGSCIRKQALNHSLDRWVSNMPGYAGTVYGWNEWENNCRQMPNLLFFSHIIQLKKYKLKFTRIICCIYWQQFCIYLLLQSCYKLCCWVQRTLWSPWMDNWFQA